MVHLNTILRFTFTFFALESSAVLGAPSAQVAEDPVSTVTDILFPKPPSCPKPLGCVHSCQTECGGVYLRACNEELAEPTVSRCKEYFDYDDTCTPEGRCWNNITWPYDTTIPGGIRNRPNSWVVAGGCCDMFDSEDCSGMKKFTACNTAKGRRFGPSETVGGVFGSARCYFPAQEV